jgi:hypothetical protein
VLFPCICVLQLKLFHLNQTSSLLSSPFPIVAYASLRILYSFLYINHIQGFEFLPFPYSSHEWSPLRVQPMCNDTTAFVLGVQSAHEGEHVAFGLLNLANFT